MEKLPLLSSSSSSIDRLLSKERSLKDLSNPLTYQNDINYNNANNNYKDDNTQRKSKSTPSSSSSSSSSSPKVKSKDKSKEKMITTPLLSPSIPLSSANSDNNSSSNNFKYQSTTENESSKKNTKITFPTLNHIPVLQQKIRLVSEEKDVFNTYSFDELLCFLTLIKEKEQSKKEDEKITHPLRKSLDKSMNEITTTTRRMKRVSSHLYTPTWIDLQGLTDEQIDIVGEHLGLHSLTINEIKLDGDTPEKSEEFPEYLLIICSELVQSRARFNQLRENLFYIVLFSEYIVVFHRYPLSCFDHVVNSFKYLSRSQLTSSQWLLFAFFDAINEGYSELYDNITKEVEVLEDFSFLDFEEVEFNDTYLRLGRASRHATQILLSLLIKFDILSSILRGNIDKEIGVHLNNVKDRIYFLKQNMKLTEDLLENLKNVFISKISLMMNEESHKLNISMSRFTSLSLLFLPITLCVTIMGMNVKIPGTTKEDKESSGLVAFFVIGVILGIIVIVNAFTLRKYLYQ